MHIFRTIGVVGILTTLFLSSAVALAEERPVPTRPIRVEAVKEVKDRVQAVREEEKDKMEAKREEMKTQMEAKREEAKVRGEEKRAKAEERLSEIKDKKKQELVQRLAKQFEKLNKTWTDHFIKQLDQYDAVVLKIQDRATIAMNAGKDVSVTTTALQSAKTAIDSARTAIIVQATKTYVLDESTVATIAPVATQSGQEQLVKNAKNSFQELHKTLFTDLTALRDGPMREVRKSVQGAFQTLEKVPAVNEDTASTTVETN